MLRTRGFSKRRLGLWAGIGLVVVQALAMPARAAEGDASFQPTARPPGYGEVKVVVLGVTAPFFTFGLVKRFQQIPGVEHTSFNLLRGTADILVKPGAAVSDEDLRRAVRNASYSIGSIQWVAHPSAVAAGN